MSVAPPCPATSDLGVAVCIVGFARTLGTPQVHKSLARHFRGHLPRVDIFGVISRSGADTAKGQWQDMSAESLAPAVRALAPVAWEDTPDAGGPRCGLLCMRQFDRLQRCRQLIAARERQCAGRYAWVAKARPDVTIGGGGWPGAERTLEADGLRGRGDTVYKDRRAGDIVNYIPRRHWDNVSRVLANTSCTAMRPLGVDCTHVAASTGGGNCKCNAWLSVAVARLLGLRLAYHRYTVQVVRTRQATDVISEARHRFGGDGMRALHNRSRAAADLRHLDVHDRGV